MTHRKSNLAFLLSLGLVVGGCASDEAGSPKPAKAGDSPNALSTLAGTRVASSAPAKPMKPASATAVNRYIASMRDELSRGKVGIINDVMKLSTQESTDFWPIYQQYESELFELGDQRIAGIQQFASDTRDGKLDDGEANRLASSYFDYEGKRLELLKKYHGLLALKLSPVRAAQFAQIEHRVGTVVDLLIASELPLITPGAPVKGD